MQPLINILIRTSNRPALFTRCLDSILSQDYKNVRIIVSVDNPNVKYVPQWIETVEVEKSELEYGYDLYINDLKALVTEGYFIVIDDDDFLVPGCLSKIEFNSPAILVQLNHMGNILPRDNKVLPGLVGMPCVILHHSLKEVADLDGGDHGDYHWIKKISEKVEFDFQPVVVVESDRKGNGLAA